MKKKGQAAMEFLMTYGWAILAAIIVIGVLAVYLTDLPGSGGVSSLDSPLYLVTSNIDVSDNGANLDIRNDRTDVIDVQGITIDFGTFTCNTLTAANNVSGGSSGVFQVTCPASSFTAGDSYSGSASVSYFVGGSTVQQVTSGRVSGTAIA